MTDLSPSERFEELEAGRVLGDLDEAEWTEWRGLSERNDVVRDRSLEWTAAVLDSVATTQDQEALPAALIDTLHEDMASFLIPEDAAAGLRLVDLPASAQAAEKAPVVWWQRPNLAWAAAAVFAGLLLVSLLSRPGAGPDSQTFPIAALEERAQDLSESRFAGVGSYEGMDGQVFWSDELQEGYMRLGGLPLNDPSVRQYQLWIVDPSRDEAPVDGGVFDVAAEGDVEIPIDAKLAVSRPKAFVITLEKPGGVVKSKQEVVVAVAEAS